MNVRKKWTIEAKEEGAPPYGFLLISSIGQEKKKGKRDKIPSRRERACFSDIVQGVMLSRRSFYFFKNEEKETKNKKNIRNILHFQKQSRT